MFKKNKRYQKGGTQQAPASPMTNATGKTIAFHPEMYSAWGNAQQAFDEGWMPTSSQSGKTIYQNRIPIYNYVDIPGSGQRGHFEVAGNDNGTFDIYTADSQGKMLGEYIQKGGSVEQTRKYFNRSDSPMGSRASMIMKGTGPEGGTYGYDQPYAVLKKGGFTKNMRKKTK